MKSSRCREIAAIVRRFARAYSIVVCNCAWFRAVFKRALTMQARSGKAAYFSVTINRAASAHRYLPALVDNGRDTSGRTDRSSNSHTDSHVDPGVADHDERYEAFYEG